MRSSIIRPSKLRCHTLTTHLDGRNFSISRWLDPQGRAVGGTLEWLGQRWWIERIDWQTTPTPLAEQQGTARQAARQADRVREAEAQAEGRVAQMLPVRAWQQDEAIPETPPEAVDRMAPLQRERRYFVTHPSNLHDPEPATGPHADLAKQLRRRNHDAKGRTLSSAKIAGIIEGYLRTRTFMGAGRHAGVSDPTAAKYCKMPEVQALLTAGRAAGETPREEPSEGHPVIAPANPEPRATGQDDQAQSSSDERTPWGLLLTTGIS